MNTFPPQRNDRLTQRRAWPALAGVLVFGALMGLRAEFGSIWARAAIAACAFVALGVVIKVSRNRHKD
ncbi:MAG: hypothetical protein WCK77_02595 [Verrucomicrobiota bacterium]